MVLNNGTATASLVYAFFGIDGTVLLLFLVMTMTMMLMMNSDHQLFIVINFAIFFATSAKRKE